MQAWEGQACGVKEEKGKGKGRCEGVKKKAGMQCRWQCRKRQAGKGKKVVAGKAK